MASRSGHRRVDHSSPLVDLDDVFADDALIDALAASPWGTAGHPQRLVQASDGRHATPATAEPLVELFDNWRLELAQQPIPDLPPLPKAVVSGGPRPRRPHRPALAVAAAIAALLVGSTFVGSRQATEGSALWNVTAVLWPDRVESVASRNRVQTAIEVAQVALNEGRPADAQAALLGASFEIGKVDDADGRRDLQSSLEGLWKQAAPAGSPSAPSEQRQLAVDGAPSSTAQSTTTSAAQQVAALELLVPPPLTGVQIAVPEVLTPGPGSAGSVGVMSTSSPGGANGGLAGISAAATAAGPVVGSEVPVTDVKTPSATVEPPATVDPSTDPPTIESPSSVTEPAPAPTPSLPTPTVESPGTATADGAAAQSVSGLTGDSSSTEASDSTAVLPTP